MKKVLIILLSLFSLVSCVWKDIEIENRQGENEKIEQKQEMEIYEFSSPQWGGLPTLEDVNNTTSSDLGESRK